MKPVTIGLIALLVSLYFVSQPQMDPRTTATIAAILFGVTAFATQTPLMWLFVYFALGIISTLVVVYWASKNLIHFKHRYSVDYQVPAWMPFFFAQGFFATHLLFVFLTKHRYLDSDGYDSD